VKYADPYLAGVGLGLVLLAAFVVTGHGLGVSGAFAAAAAGTVAALAPAAAQESPYLARFLGDGSPWGNWLVLEVIGVCIGAFLSAAMAGRLGRGVERGAGVSVRARLGAAATGGALMGVGAVMARGCTSGQALTGGALLSVGSWAFMIGAFAAGFSAAPLVRRAWS
jgi:hypothetical protein